MYMKPHKLACTRAVSLLWLCRLLAAGGLFLGVGCQCGSDYEAAREKLDAEIDVLPLPPNSQVLARHDGLSTGQIEACRSVITELLVGNDMPASEVYGFLRRQLTAQGWSVGLEGPRGVVLRKDDRYGIEISDNYYATGRIPRDVIEDAQPRFVSLVFIGIDYGIYDPEWCEEAMR